MKRLTVMLIMLTFTTLAIANSGGTYFKNCTEARNKGHSNIKKGEPGYRPGLDRDKDGIACESK